MTPFDVILVPFPFADLKSTKRRPCLVLATFRPRTMRDHLIVCMMTSQVDGPRFPFDEAVRDLESAGLPKPTLIRLAKMVTVDSSIVVKKLGTLSLKDKRKIKDQFKSLFEAIA